MTKAINTARMPVHSQNVPLILPKKTPRKKTIIKATVIETSKGSNTNHSGIVHQSGNIIMIDIINGARPFINAIMNGANCAARPWVVYRGLSSWLFRVHAALFFSPLFH